MTEWRFNLERSNQAVWPTCVPMIDILHIFVACQLTQEKKKPVVYVIDISFYWWFPKNIKVLFRRTVAMSVQKLP